MLKKILMVTGLIVFIGVLVFGAVNRTLARTGNEGTNQNAYGYAAQQASSGNNNHERAGAQSYAEGQHGRSSRNSSAARNLPANQDRRESAQPHLYGQGGESGIGKNESAVNGQGNRGQQGGAGRQSETVIGELSEQEIQDLFHLREEEKLAHDVYLALYEKWGLSTFQEIALSEQTHTEAIQNIIIRYTLEDPATGEAGRFNNPELQAMYDSLVAQGSQSLVDALKVGAAIEELDILDLEEALARTHNTEFQQVYNNLLRGSTNHLRAFVTALQAQTGEIYQPQYLSLEAYQAIIAGNTSLGENGNSQGGKGYRGGRP